jgi:conjugative relaxase-like TrwC/TraI family protein
MLSISPPMRGSGQGNYYLELACEDYYLQGGEPPGRWIGKGAARFNLSGEVRKEAFRNLLQGFDPEGKIFLVQNAGNEHRQSGWDLTFSAPKSVSAAWSQSPQDIRREFQAAQQAAVEKAIEYLQEVAAVTRRGQGGVSAEKASFVAATFEHGTSRALDPQLHTHALLLNISARQDGTTGTIRSADVFRHKMATGALYRAELAHQLEKRLGLTAQKVKSWFELRGVSEELSKEFSKRRTEIEAVLAERKLDNAVAAKIAALDTRHKKGHVARATLFETWRQAGAKHHWTEKELHSLIKGPREKTASQDSATRLASEALAEIIAHQSFFTERDLVRRVAESAQGQGVNADQVLAAVRDELCAKSIVHIGHVRGEKAFTTQEILAQERDLLSIVERSKTKDTHQIAPSKVEKALKGKPKLSTEQRDAVKHITATPGSIQALSGLAGTGKTSALSAAREIWEYQGYTVIGAALSGKAAQGLEEGAKIKSATIHKTLQDLDKGFVAIEVRKKHLFPNAPSWSPASKIELPYLKFRIGGDKVTLDAKTVLVVDEAGMVGTRQMKDLLERAEAARAKVVLVGDAKQLQPIEAGAPFRAIADRVGEAKLTEIKRQHEQWARDVVKKFAEGRTHEALSDLAARGQISVSKTLDDAERRLVADWKRAGVGAPEQNLILVATNEKAAKLNRLAQDARKKAGAIKRRSVTIGEDKIHEGDRVLFTKNARTLGVSNGTFATVTEVSRKSIRVTLDNKKSALIPLRYSQDIRLGYAATTHKAQGMTTENAFILVEPSNQSRELAYVQASRACAATRFYTDEITAGCELSELAKRMQKSDAKQLAHEVIQSQCAQQSQA